ncbi:FtsX-like permease family protein [Thermophagus sp. OGC60D27]|uniref:FtsX-like permease family protein n=1 Tax=Thermophagus sp. OGC60D27 TaxID=3458415 RepID=UPI0040378DDA
MKTLLMIFRRLKKNKTAMMLGVSGMVAGLVCVLFIFFWIVDEIQYNRYNDKLDRIFVVHAFLEGGTEKVPFRGCPPAVAPSLASEYPEVIRTARFLPPYMEFLLQYEDKKYLEKTAFADFSLFDIMTLPFKYGNRGEENVENKIVLTETAARKYFGEENPVGRVMKFNNNDNMIVVGVIKDIPKNSSISFSALMPLEKTRIFFQRDDFLFTWYNNAFTTFGLLRSPDDFEKVASSITNRIQKELPESTNFLRAYKWKDKYLIEDNNIRNVRIFILIAFLVLLTATLNFINLNTARSVNQIKESGLRKTLGATRWSLIRLIYTDIAVVCLLAFIISIFLAFAGLPLFISFIGRPIDPMFVFSWEPLLAIVAIYFFTVFLAGSYPAFYLSGFRPAITMKSGFRSVKAKGWFRNAMVVAIFIVSLLLLSGTFIISKQTDYLQNMDLGYDRSQLIYVYLNGKLKNRHQAFKQEINRNTNVESSTVISHLPFSIGNNGEGWKWDGKDPSFKPLVTDWQGDTDLLKTFGIELKEGTFFRNNDQKGVVINETFANMIGWNQFEGKNIEAYGTTLPILGVIKDIHFNTLSEDIKPLAIQAIGDQMSTNFIVVKTNRYHIHATLNYIEEVARKFEPDIPLTYGFFEEEIEKMLASERNLRKLVSVFSGFSVIVFVLGLLGVIMFMAEQRTKEIGIRKCIGEPVFSIVTRLIKPFLISGGIAFSIAVPLSWWTMNRWLQNFAFRIDLTISIFLSAGILILIIALMTVALQSWRAATQNPVDALRDE